MNQEPTIYTSDQKPNSRSSSSSNMSEDINKRRRLAESNGQTTPVNNMFRPNVTQSILIQQQLSNIFGNSSNPTPPSCNNNNNGVSPTMSRSQSLTVSNSNSPKSESPTPSLTNLHIEETREKTRHELFVEQMRLRQEYKKRQKENFLQAKELEKVKKQEQQNLIREQEELRKKEELEKQKAAEKIEKAQVESDDDVMVDEEMTNKNVCMGMIKTDIVVEKSPLILIRDDQYEIVSLESEGKLNNENYSFKVTSRSQPPRFYGWIPFQDTKVMGPLVDHRLIWWDAVIPRGKATNTRTPICIILYCRPDLLGTIAKYFESQRVILKTPPFYNPACRYSNPHHQILEQQYNYHQYQQRQQQQQQQQLQQQQQQPHQLHQQQQPLPQHGYGGSNYQGYSSNYASYQYDPRNPYSTNNYRPSYNYQQPVYRDPGQEQKDIEMLLSSIPSDVPLLSKKKKKRAIKKNKKQVESNIIEIKDDDDEEEDEIMSEAEEDDEEEEDDPGHIEGLTCHLMEHQIQGVSWMIDRENNETSNGGILADMGLGKTIQTIALMASTMTSEESDDTEEPAEEENNHRITLIVTPLALVQQWVDEIISKTEKDKLRVLKHHGPNRTKNPAVFHRYDVIVTTYQVVASDMPSTSDKKKKKKHKRKNSMEDFVVKGDDDDDEEDEKSTYPSKYTPLKKDHGPLFQVNWHRIVLDEAQQIKNRTTKSSLSCAALSSKKRWCLTGTPIQNNVDELYSLLRFLRIQPLSEYATFKKNISIPIMNGDTRLAMSRLKAVLMAVMLRRTKSVLNNNNKEEVSEEKEKGESEPSSPSSSNNEENGSLSKKLALQLPSRQKTDILLSFTEHERAIYENRLTLSKRSIGKTATYMNMLCKLLRLRQACDHPKLLLNSIEKDKDNLDVVSDVPDNDHWSLSQQEVCELCGRSNSENKDKTPYCNDCDNMLKMNDNQTSTKMRKLIEMLKETQETNPGEKTIVFSQFTTMMDLMEGPLRQNGFKFCRYDGSMSTQLREKSLTRLKYDPKCTVMLISLKCGSLGLNLTSANRVILADPWWNPALEEQAIDRVHRIGQRLPVYVTRLLIENTVELKIIQLQEKKAQLSKGALGDGLVKNAKLTSSEIRSLFNL